MASNLPPYNQTAARPIPTYELGLYQRTPQPAAAATYVEVGPIVSPTITWSDVLDRDGQLQASCQPDRLDADVRAALRAQFTPESAPQGCELRLHRSGDGVVWAGPLVGGQIQAGTLKLDARGLAYYLRYMWITSNLDYSAVDQWTIGKGLVDHWQALAYGDFGLDTSGIGTSGTTRTRAYLAAENPNVHAELAMLAAVAGGFNWWVNPADRTVEFAASRGADLSGSIIFGQHNIADADISADTAAEQLASEAFGVGTSQDSAPLTSAQGDTAVREAFGRVGVAGSFDGVSVQGTLDGHTQQLLDDRTRPTFTPGPGVRPTEEADVGDFGPGDTVGWSYDAGLGLQQFSRRLAAVEYTVDAEGAEQIRPMFL